MPLKFARRHKKETCTRCTRSSSFCPLKICAFHPTSELSTRLTPLVYYAFKTLRLEPLSPAIPTFPVILTVYLTLTLSADAHHESNLLRSAHRKERKPRNYQTRMPQQYQLPQEEDGGPIVDVEADNGDPSQWGFSRDLRSTTEKVRSMRQVRMKKRKWRRNWSTGSRGTR